MQQTTKRGIRLAVAGLLLGSLAGLAGMNVLRGHRGTDLSEHGMPPVSADAERNVAARLDASLAARVEVEGQHFDVYVGENAPTGTNDLNIWSVAIPAQR